MRDRSDICWCLMMSFSLGSPGMRTETQFLRSRFTVPYEYFWLGRGYAVFIISRKFSMLPIMAI
jgi:hypothetical protein